MHRPTLTTLTALAALTACNFDHATPEHPGGSDSTAAAPGATPVAADAAQWAKAPAQADKHPALADGHVTREEFESAQAEFGRSLERLSGLEILSVGALIAAMPSDANHCYGPCEHDRETQAWMQEEVRQIDRFEALVDAAQRAAREVDAAARTATWGEASDAVRVLADLKIIEVRGIHHESPSCYSANCPGDPRRAAVIVALAKNLDQP